MATKGSYSLSISVVDQYSKHLADFNKRVAAMQKPFQNLQKQADRAFKLSGLQGFTNQFAKLGSTARDAVRPLAAIAEPLAAITSVASIAGMAKLVSSTAEWGLKTQQTANILGMAAANLQSLQGASSILGLGSAGLADQAKRMQDIRRAVRIGADPQGSVAYQSIGANAGMSIDEITRRALDRAAAMKARGVDPATIRALLGSVGVDERLIGTTGAQYAAQQARGALLSRSGSTDVAALANLQTSINGTEVAATGLARAIGSSLAPSLSPLLDRFNTWLATSPTVNAWLVRLSEGAQQFSQWVQRINWDRVNASFQRFLDVAKGVYDGLGGVTGIAEKLIALKVAGWALGFVGPAAQMVQAFVALRGAASAAEMGMLAFAAGEAAALLPIAAVVAGAAAVGLAGYEIYQHWSGIRSFFEGMWNGVKSAFQSNTLYLRTTVETLFFLPSLIINHWTPISDFFTNMWSGIKSAFSSGWDHIGAIVDRIKGAVDWVASSPVGKAIGWARDTVASGVQSFAAGVDRAAGYRAPGPSTEQQKAIQQQGVAILQGEGLSHAQAVGVMANAMQESSLNAQANNGSHVGLFQWDSARAAAIQKHFGKAVLAMTAGEQIAAAAWELKTSERGADAALRSTSTSGAAAAAFNRTFERSGEEPGSAGYNRRLEFADQVDRNTTVNHKMDVTFANAPQGAQVNLTSGGGNFGFGSLKYVRPLNSSLS